MKRKLLALLLSAAMLLAICLPALCAAAESDVVSPLEENAESGTVSSLEENAESGTAPDASELYTQLMATESIAEVEAIISGMEESELEASLSALDQEQLNALQAHLDALAQAEYILPQTVVFTEAGPFLPAVNVASARRLLRTSSFSARQTDNGLILNKTAEYDATFKSVKIRLEAYTTGTVTTTTTTVPVDIVLVLDQSGSMADNFDGNDSRQYALKQAVNNFIDAVAAKYSTDADHRMAIVTFGSSASTRQDWTYVDPDDGAATLKESINGLPNSPSGATNVAAGMEQAETLMGSGYNYTGSNTQRQKVVIVFTDGVPTKNRDFDTDVATKAIASAKRLKDDKNGGATVYTIGIFGNANPSQLHDSSVNGNVGDKWEGLKILFWGDVSKVSVPAANRFLNYVSSNFRDATEIGLKRESWNIVLAAHESFEITKNFTRTASNYYLTAKDSTSLNEIFQTISNNISTPSISLGSETVIKDVLTEQFVMPANTSDIKLYTADAKADGTFEDAQSAEGVTAAISGDGDTVSVTGFDFNANFVSKTAKTDGSYGKKLIIEFNAPVREGFFGGNNVQTNDAASGVYVNGEADQPLEAFPIPKVNIPLNVPAFKAVDANIYLLGTTPKADALCDLSVYENAEAWQKAYVKFGTPSIPAGAVSNTADSPVTVSLTVAPKTDGSGAKGTPATAVTKNANANVLVFKPELTFKDSEIYLGETASYLGQNVDSELWKHGQTLDTDVTMMGVRPTLGRTYSPVEGAFAEETDVSVTTAINGTDVTSYTTLINTGDNATDHQFTVKIKTCTLTIAKSGAQAVDGGQTFLFHITGAGNNKADQVDLKVVVSGNGSAVICGLPIGTYTVTEDEGWSWRYEAQTGTQQAVLAPNKDGDAVTLDFVNNRVAKYWLDGNAYAENAFSAVSQ